MDHQKTFEMLIFTRVANKALVKENAALIKINQEHAAKIAMLEKRIGVKDEYISKTLS